MSSSDLAWYLALRLLQWALWLADLALGAALKLSLARGSAQERLRARAEGRTVRLDRVLLRARGLTDMRARSLDDFLLLHDRYVEPGYVLLNRHVTLFTVDGDEVLFCVTDPAVDVCDVSAFPFLFCAQFEMAERLAIMSAEDFHEMADGLGDPTVDVTLLHMTARCGSTLISRAVSAVPRTRSLSEPFVLLRVHELYRRGALSLDGCRRLARSCVRLLCKTEPGSGLEWIFVRSPASCSPLLAFLAQAFPDFHFVFSTRHPRPSMRSLMKLMRPESDSLYGRSGMLRDWLLHVLPIPYEDGDISSAMARLSHDELFAYIYVGSLSNFLRNRSAYKHCVLYEDLASDPASEMGRLLAALGIPSMEEHLSPLLEAMRGDSQGGRFVQRGGNPELPDRLWTQIDGAFASLGMDNVSCDMSLNAFRDVLQKKKKK